MPFEIPQNKQQKDLLNEIFSSLKSIQCSIDSLNQHISKLESTQNDSNSHIIADIQVQISNITNKLEQFDNKNKSYSYFGGIILLFFIIVSIAFAFHFLGCSCSN